MTREEVLAKVSTRRREPLSRVLTQARYEAVMQGLRERRWSSIEQARAELGATRATMSAIRSALKLAGLMPWGGDWQAFSLDSRERPAQQRLFIKQGDTYRYTKQ